MKKIYLITCQSYHVLNNKINKITNGNTNITTFSLNNVSIYDCIDDASYFGLFEDDRVIIIKDVKYYGGKFLYEEESAAIIKFLSNLDEYTTVIFVCDEIKKAKDLTKKVVALGAEIIDLSTIDDATFNELLNEHIKENGLNVEEKAKSLIIKNCLNNLDIAIQEIDKLSLVDKIITESIVNTYGSVEENLDTFEFSNAVVAKNFDKAFELLDKLLAGGVDAYSIVGLLASSFVNMYMVKDAMNHNLSDEEIAKKFGYSSTGRVYVMKKNGKIYTQDQLKEVILALSDLDIKIKTGYNPVYGIKEFLLNL